MIPESDPEAIFKAIETNTTMSLNIAPAEHDFDCRQVCGKKPVSKKVRQAFITGQAICLVTTLLNYYLGINKEKFHTRRKVSSHLSPDLIGGIHKHGLVPLQSIDKESEQENVWMGAVHAVPWMASHVIENQAEELQLCDNQLVCIVIPGGDERLDQFQQFGAPGPYTGYVKPVTSSSIVKVFGEDTVGFPANAVPDFIANAPHHPSVVPLLTEEQKLERGRAYQRSYSEANRERGRAYQRSYSEANRERGRAYQRIYNQSYSKSEANRCTFSQEYCNKRKQSRCNGMCIEHYRQSSQTKWPKTEVEASARRFDWGKCSKCSMMGSCNDPENPGKPHEHNGKCRGTFRRQT